MEQEFVDLVRSYIPEDVLFLHVGRNLGGMIELKDGTLMSLSGAGRAISADGGVTWGEPEPICDENGMQLEEGLVSLFPPHTGWQFTGISQYHPIGRPFSLTWQGGNTGQAAVPIAARPDRVADGRKDNPTIDEWFDVSAFEPHFKPPDPENPGSFLPEEGNAGRNILRSPGFALTDIGINKNFYWGPENRYRVQFRAELFNSFNTANFGVPQGAGALGGGAVQIGTNPNAARINRTAGPVRQVQFALKFYY